MKDKALAAEQTAGRGPEDYSSILLLLSEIKEGLRINWIPQLSQVPQRLNTDLHCESGACSEAESTVRTGGAAGCRDSDQPPSSQPQKPPLTSGQHNLTEQLCSHDSFLQMSQPHHSFNLFIFLILVKFVFSQLSNRASKDLKLQAHCG